eukprot:scaffold24868_cov101-Isochrysis_galbana.AAC.2
MPNMPPAASPLSGAGRPPAGTLSKKASTMGGSPQRAADDCCTTRASPRASAAASRRGIAALSRSICEMLFTWASRLYPSAVVPSGDAMIPELSMSTSSSPPDSAASFGPAARTESREVRSQSMLLITQSDGATARTASTALVARSDSRFIRITFAAPSFAAVMANFSPRPLPVAPVTAITLPLAASGG